MILSCFVLGLIALSASLGPFLGGRIPPLNTFAANAVRLQLHVFAYNLGNFMRTLAMAKTVEAWSLTSLRERLIRSAQRSLPRPQRDLSNGRSRGVSRQMFADLLPLIARPRAPPAARGMVACAISVRTRPTEHPARPPGPRSAATCVRDYRDYRDRCVLCRGRLDGSDRESHPPARLSCGHWHRRSWTRVHR